MQINLHQTHHDIGDFESIFQHLTSTFMHPERKGLHLFPELFFTGYPLQDLVFQKAFIHEYTRFLKDIDSWCLNNWKSNQSVAILAGGLHYELGPQGMPIKIQNVVYELRPGQSPKIVCIKKLLPNYDLYEEKKYFTPGNETQLYQFENKKIALLICEDMWFSHLHESDPVEKYKSLNQAIDLVINLSASPFHIGKYESRVERAKEVANQLSAPVVYVNRVGGEDEILFDGRSFIHDGKNVLLTCQSFEVDHQHLDLPKFNSSEKQSHPQVPNSWQTIFSHRLENNRLKELTEEECHLILKASLFGLQEYASKNGMQKFTIALSGGIDSALVLAMTKLSLKPNQTVEAIYMPGLYSAPESYDLSFELCRNLGIKLISFPIKFIHSTIRNNYLQNFGTELKNLADENIQSRLRGNILYARSNQIGSMCINTSNKSEIAVGYSTIYGDAVGAISLLGDLYKTQVYSLAQHINKHYGNIIPQGIIERAPSAELRENQKDQDSLPDYPILDAILESLLSGQYSPKELVEKGYSVADVQKTSLLISRAEYKRKQFCPIIKLFPKSFGFGYRMPISKKFIE